jgi:hypothetical protein
MEVSKMIKWTTNKETMELESKVADRAIALAKKFGTKYNKMTAVMDIDACHSNGNPLRLADLLAADDTNFAHDIFGIRANINRETGKLENFFVPRYSI